MEQPNAGELVHVAQGNRQVDGIVFDVPSRSKVVVAMVDARRGPVLRTVPAKSLTERAQEGPHDQALRLLVRRTPPPVPGGARSGGEAARGRRGFTRATSHRTTSK